MGEIKFGTDGWRAVISEDFTIANVRLVAQAIADYLLAASASAWVVVGYDTRFLSRRYAEEVAGVLAANGLAVRLTNQAAPTPAVALAVKNSQAAGGVMITASHNPPEYNGIKFKGAYGGSALPEMTSQIEKWLQENKAGSKAPLSMPLEEALASGQIELFDPQPEYFDRLAELVDIDALQRARLPVVVDPMYGAARGYLKAFLERYDLAVVEIRGEENPGFGGVNPEPIGRNLEDLRAAVLANGAVAGLATDGDADRVGAIDHEGNFVDSHRIFALLLDHLAGRRGWDGDVVKTFSTTEMVDLLARHYGRQIFVTPIGFKHICRYMLERPILIGGEESGGIGITRHLPERDGVLNSLLLMEIMAVTGQNLVELVAGLMGRIGPHYYDRIDLHLRPAEQERFRNGFLERVPARLAGQAVEKTDTLDGVKLFLEDGSWILFRASGTEPVVRVYAEGPSPEAVAALLGAGRQLVEMEAG